MSTDLLEQHLIQLLESGLKIPYTDNGLLIISEEIAKFNDNHTLKVWYKLIPLPLWKRIINYIYPLFKEEHETIHEWVKND